MPKAPQPKASAKAAAPAKAPAAKAAAPPARKKPQPAGVRWWWWLALGGVGLFLGMNLGLRSTGAQERACDLPEGSWVLTEAFTPRFGEVKPEQLVLLRQRGGERETLGRVVAVEGDAVAWRQGRLWINDAPLELRGEPARPVRVAALKTRKVLLKARAARGASEERASLWRGPLGERGDGARREQGAVPSGLGLKATITQVPRQHVYVIYGGEESGVLGRLTPLADVVAASWMVLPAAERDEEPEPAEVEAQRSPAVRTQRRQR